MLLRRALFDFVTTNFPPPYVNQVQRMALGPADLIRAAIHSSGPWYGAFRAAARDPIFGVQQALSTLLPIRRLANGHASLVPPLASRPMSDRKHMHYRLGMALTRIAAERHLRVPFFSDLESLDPRHFVQFRKTGKRPDFVGIDLDSNWHVVESSAARKIVPSLHDYAKEQAKAIRSINGRAPRTYTSAITELEGNPIKVELRDPPAPEEGEEIQIDVDELVREHYRPIMQAFEESEREFTFVIERNEFVITPFGDGPFFVGLPPKLWQLLRSEKPATSVNEYLMLRGTGFREDTKLPEVEQFHSIGLDQSLVLLDYYRA